MAVKINFNNENGEIYGYEDTEISNVVYEHPIELPSDIPKEEIRNYKVNLDTRNIEPISSSEKELRRNEKFRFNRENDLNIVDKYQQVLMYDDLSNDEKQDLKDYRKALLDSTKTGEYPTPPTWMNGDFSN